MSSLWFSADRDSGRPPIVPRVRRAYLLADGEAEAGVPADADLVFRVPLPRRPGRPNAYARPAKRANGVLICPKEQGIDRRVEITCSSCRICFTRRGRRDHPARPARAIVGRPDLMPHPDPAVAGPSTRPGA